MLSHFFLRGKRFKPLSRCFSGQQLMNIRRAGVARETVVNLVLQTGEYVTSAPHSHVSHNRFTLISLCAIYLSFLFNNLVLEKKKGA